MRMAKSTDSDCFHMLRIPRRYALQVAPVVLICILFMGLQAWTDVATAISCGLLSTWHWLQWPRRKFTYAVFAVGLFALSIIPLSLTIWASTASGSYKLRIAPHLYDLGIALLLTTALAIAVRLLLVWRLVDYQAEEQADETSRGSLFDLVVAVSSCALMFALIRLRLAEDFSSYWIAPLISGISTSTATAISAVVFLRLFAPLKFGPQMLLGILVAPILIGTGVALQYLIHSLSGENQRVLALAIAPVVGGAAFASVCSLCGLRFGGFEVRGFRGKTSRVLAIVVCISLVGGGMFFINLIPYGTPVYDSYALKGWPFAHTVTLENSVGFLERTITFVQTPALLADYLIALVISVSFGAGIPILVGRLLGKRSAHAREELPIRQRTTTLIVLMLVSILLGFAATALKLSRFSRDAAFEASSHAAMADVVKSDYKSHFIDDRFAVVLSALGYGVPDGVITEISVAVDNETGPDVLLAACDLPELRLLRFWGDIEEVSIECIEKLARNGRIQYLFVEAGSIDPQTIDAISNLRALKTLSISEPLPDKELVFDDQFTELDLDLTQNSQLVRFPELTREISLKLSDKTDLRGLHNLETTVRVTLNCVQRTKPIDLGLWSGEYVDLNVGNHDVELNFQGPIDKLELTVKGVLKPKDFVREPNVSVHLKEGVADHCWRLRFDFGDSACKTLDFGGAATKHSNLWLTSTKEMPLSTQLKGIEKAAVRSLTLNGIVDRAACAELAKCSELEYLTINPPKGARGIPFDVIKPDSLPSLRNINIAGSISNQELIGLREAAKGLQSTNIDGS